MTQARVLSAPPAVREDAPSLSGRLHVAHLQAMAGAPRAARRLCADLAMREMPSLHRDPDAMRAMLAVLLLAGGLEQAGRLLRARSGIAVRIVARDRPSPPGTGAEPALREEDGALVVLLDAGRLAGLDRAEVARRWSGAILGSLPAEQEGASG